MFNAPPACLPTDVGFVSRRLDQNAFMALALVCIKRINRNLLNAYRKSGSLRIESGFLPVVNAQRIPRRDHTVSYTDTTFLARFYWSETDQIPLYCTVRADCMVETGSSSERLSDLLIIHAIINGQLVKLTADTDNPEAPDNTFMTGGLISLTDALACHLPVMFIASQSRGIAGSATTDDSPKPTDS